jgi:hypothetical protein
MKAMEDQILATKTSFQEGGLSMGATWEAIIGPLRDVVSASQEYGFELDDNTKALVAQAEAAGYAFPVDPMHQMVDLMAAMVEAVGGKLPESYTRAAEAAQHLADVTTGATDQMATQTEGMATAVAGFAGQVDMASEATTNLGMIGASMTDAMSSGYNDLGISIQDVTDMMQNMKIPPINIPVNFQTGGVPSTEPPPVPGYAGGSDGLRDFGAGTHVVLHNEEAVMTKDQYLAHGGMSVSNTALLNEIANLKNELRAMTKQIPRGIRDSIQIGRGRGR